MTVTYDGNLPEESGAFILHAEDNPPVPEGINLSLLSLSGCHIKLCIINGDGNSEHVAHS